MKVIYSFFAGTLLTLSTFGQGQVNFDNLFVGAPFGCSDGYGPGAAGKAQLYHDQGGTLLPVGPIQGFLTFSQEATKYIVGTVVTVPSAPVGSQATFVVRVWVDSAASWEASILKGESNPVTVTLGGGTIVPPNLDGLQPMNASFPCIPEPSPVALGILATAVVLLRPRR